VSGQVVRPPPPGSGDLAAEKKADAKKKSEQRAEEIARTEKEQVELAAKLAALKAEAQTEEP
jgi:hypothetical protein